MIFLKITCYYYITYIVCILNIRDPTTISDGRESGDYINGIFRSNGVKS